jgi:hypothetical protein
MHMKLACILEICALMHGRTEVDEPFAGSCICDGRFVFDALAADACSGMDRQGLRQHTKVGEAHLPSSAAS